MNRFYQLIFLSNTFIWGISSSYAMMTPELEDKPCKFKQFVRKISNFIYCCKKRNIISRSYSTEYFQSLVTNETYTLPKSKSRCCF